MSLTALSRSRAFLRDGAYVTDPVLTDRAATYTPGVSERRGAATTFLHSGLKNADAQSGTTQTVAATRQYDAFGNLLSSTGTWGGPLGYAGGFGYQEDATGLKLLGHRYYDSSTGRFLTRDPIQDGRNWYVYCGNDPVVYVDEDGLQRGRVIKGIIDWIRNLLKPKPPVVSPRTPAGRRGKPLEVKPGTNKPDIIKGRKYTGHAHDRMQGRGIPPSKVEDVIRKGKRKPGKQPGTTEISDGEVTVIVNKKGDVITVIPK
jgi:RHS repeat-associated protein